ncbi:MAG: hypothetical protein IPK94_08115 [Saprospiraceae bacterium]|nr:hypothetical protein [Saprospiraceae bacterium]
MVNQTANLMPLSYLDAGDYVHYPMALAVYPNFDRIDQPGQYSHHPFATQFFRPVQKEPKINRLILVFYDFLFDDFFSFF